MYIQWVSGVFFLRRPRPRLYHFLNTSIVCVCVSRWILAAATGVYGGVDFFFMACAHGVVRKLFLKSALKVIPIGGVMDRIFLVVEFRSIAVLTGLEAPGHRKPRCLCVWWGLLGEKNDTALNPDHFESIVNGKKKTFTGKKKKLDSWKKGKTKYCNWLKMKMTKKSIGLWQLWQFYLLKQINRLWSGKWKWKK